MNKFGKYIIDDWNYCDIFNCSVRKIIDNTNERNWTVIFTSLDSEDNKYVIYYSGPATNLLMDFYKKIFPHPNGKYYFNSHIDAINRIDLFIEKLCKLKSFL